MRSVVGVSEPCAAGVGLKPGDKRLPVSPHGAENQEGPNRHRAQAAAQLGEQGGMHTEEEGRGVR